MKPIAISSCLALAALSLFAADPQAAKESPASTHTEKLLSTPRNTGIGDSPLVRAAKATNRLNKKPTTQVITNETLVHEGGHFTTTTAESQTQLPTTYKPSEPSLDQMAAEQKKNREIAASQAEDKKRAEQQRKNAAARAASDTAEGIYNDPPALENGPIQTIKPQSVDNFGKPPQ
jgi:hypothetical protein